ncbi:class I SAM-dependent methyltransferase [Sulfobacillus sp. hq2]|uniref:class I SAM-dependent methyltransferase n=2 Tax=Sulfobacillus TaxID=28033 RepID=UPI0035140C3B
MNNWADTEYAANYASLAAPRYRDNEIFVTSLLSLLDRMPETALDTFCGTGELALEMARRGISVTGLDVNSHLIAKATESDDGHLVRWYNQDIRTLGVQHEFDVVLCMFNSFGYFKSQRENLDTLRRMRQSLNLSGSLILEIPDFEAVLCNFVPRNWIETKTEYILVATQWNASRNWLTITLTTVPKAAGTRSRLHTYGMHLYKPRTMERMLKSVGFQTIEVHSALSYNVDGFVPPHLCYLAKT